MGIKQIRTTHGLHSSIRSGSHVQVQRFQDADERRDWQLLLQVIYFVNKCEAVHGFLQSDLWFPRALESSA